MAYEEDEYLQLSGLQHYAYCPRQWALITLENQWMENVRTVEGKQLGQFPLHNLEGIVTFGYTGASPALMGACAERG
ncbi:MAG: Dna2/Cas4 domain-containing protein, partial [Clostridia bacterium]